MSADLTAQLDSAQRGAAYLDSINVARTGVRPTGKRRLPPFGRQLLEARRKGLSPKDGVILIFLDQWGHDYRARVVVPSDLSPADCCFDFVAGLDCFLMWDTDRTEVSRCRELLREVLKSNPLRLVVVGLMGDLSKLLWGKSVGVGIECESYL